jgi:hypothetical protein
MLSLNYLLLPMICLSLSSLHHVAFDAPELGIVAVERSLHSFEYGELEQTGIAADVMGMIRDWFKNFKRSVQSGRCRTATSG